MKHFIISLIVLISLSFCSYTSVGGIAYKDSALIDASADLVTRVIVTSVNASLATVSTVSQTALPTKKSVIILDSTSATLSSTLLTDGETDGAIKVLYCKAYTLPIVIAVSQNINVKAVGGAVTKNVLENSATAFTFATAGESKTLMYRKATDKYMVIATQGAGVATLNATISNFGTL